MLAVTNLWPDVERPVYGIFVKRIVHGLNFQKRIEQRTVRKRS